MNRILRIFKKRGVIIVPLIIILTVIIIYTNRTYSASDVLGDYADLNAENPTISIHSIDIETEEIFSSIEIMKEKQQELIEAFKKAKFEKVTDGASDYDYRINIILNTGYAMFVDSEKKLINITDTHELYTIVNDSAFFEILISTK